MRSPLFITAGLLFGLGLRPLAAHGHPLQPDQTMETPTRLSPLAPGRTFIEGGSQRGRNLFHSFETFSIPEGEFVFFQVPSGVDTILTRVTGTQASQINGSLRVRRPADFFLLNPNGIQFGSQSQVNVLGSLVTTTASAIHFEELGQFSALVPSSPSPLLSIAPSAMTFAPHSASSIQIETGFTSSQRGGIEVRPFETILMVADDITLRGGRLASQQGSVILSTDTPSVLPLQSLDQGWNVSATEPATSGTITLDQRSLVRVRVNRSPAPLLESEAQIKLIGDQIHIADGSQVLAGSNSSIQIFANHLQMSEQSRIRTQTDNSQDAGSIFVTVGDRIQFTDRSKIRSFTTAKGDAGSIQISSPSVSLTGGSRISATTFGKGKGGNVQLTANRIWLAGSGIEETTNGPQEIPSGIIARTTVFQEQEGPGGPGGDILIEANQLDLQAGAQISTSSFAGGAAGTIQIDAGQVKATGVGPGGLPRDGVSGFASGIFSQSENSTESAGEIQLNLDQLVLKDGAIISTSRTGSGEGQGGTLQIEARDRILLSGQARPSAPEGASKRSSGLFVGTSGLGESGNLRLSTPMLAIRSGARISAATAGQAPGGSATLQVGNLRVEGNESQISVSSAGVEPAGQLEITAQTIRLAQQGSLIATTRSGDGGDIVLQAADSVVLRRGGQISTTAGDTQNGGDGGNIEIQTPFLVTRPSENSDITANAFSGRGGRINLTADAILGLAVRQTNTPLSDITASSEVGLPGTVQLNTPDAEPGEGLDELPTDIVDVSQQIDRSCAAQAGAASQFIVTGRGGIPLHPAMPLRHSGLREAWISSETTAAHLSEPHSPNSETHLGSVTTSVRPQHLSTEVERKQSIMPQEAVDWVHHPDGSVRLLAAIVPSRPGPNRLSPSCSEY